MSAEPDGDTDAAGAEDVLRNAVRQLLSATRHFLDAVEDVIEDDERMGKMTNAVERGFSNAGVDLRRLRDAFVGHDVEGRGRTEEGRVRRIDVE